MVGCKGKSHEKCLPQGEFEKQGPVFQEIGGRPLPAGSVIPYSARLRHRVL